MQKRITNLFISVILMLVCTAALQAQTPEIAGIVKDEAGAPLIAATVTVTPKSDPSRKKSVLTNVEGKFSFPDLLAGAPYQIMVSYIGYKTWVLENFVLKPAEQSAIIVSLKTNAELGEVVVVGYGKSSKRNLLQSVSSMKGKEVMEVPAATLAQTMAGRIPGLVITQTGGKPGKSSSIRVRAYDGFGAAKPPLFVIDGVISDQFAFDGLDATEIDNISVLKDGASASAYGVRGANGVIVVTTKRGITGPPQVNIVSSYSINEATVQPKTLSAYDEAVFENDILKQVNPSGYLNDSRYYTQDELDYFKTHNVDLLEKYYKRPTEYRTTANISGASDKVNYFVSGSFYKGTGSFDNVDYQKYNIRAKVDTRITKNLNIGLNLNTDIRNDQKPYWEYDYDNDDLTNLYQGLLTRGKMAPDYVSYNGKNYPIGTLLAWHPGEVINGNTGYNRKKWSNYQALVDVNYNLSSLVDGLTVRATFANYTRHDFRKTLNMPYNLYVTNRFGSNNHLVGDQIDFTRTKQRNDGNVIAESYNAGSFYQLNFYLNYDKAFGKHNVSATVMYEQSETNNDAFNARNQFVLSRELDQISLASSDPLNYGVGGSEFDDGRLATFARVGYNYAGKYLIEGSFRYEGSRYFIPSNRYALFPAVSVGWRISDEPFFKNNVSWVNDLKFKASFGMTGEEPNLNADGSINTTLQWEQYYRKNSGAIFGNISNGVSLGAYPNANITWAKKQAIDIGFDAALFQNSVHVSATRFMTKRKDILGDIGASVPTTWGAAYPLVNFGGMESNGYEVSIDYRKSLNKNLTFNAGFNYSYAVNKQVRINQATNIRDYQNQIGRPVGSIMGYIATDILRTQADIDALPAGYTINGAVPKLGMLNFKDIRGATSDKPDGKIDVNDQEFIAKYTTPPSTYNFNLGATWKSFSIDLLVQGTGNYYKMRSVILNNAQWLGQEAGSAAFWKDHWTPENPNGKYPVYVDEGGGGNPSTFWLDNASFIRLKNVNIGWNVPLGTSAKSAFKSLRLFLNGSNLLLLKNRIKDYDPEAQSLVAYPLNRNYTFGVNVTL